MASALAQASDHILAFFTMLRAELAFYVGCLNLREALTAAGEPVCVPVPVADEKLALSARGLYDPSLSLRLTGRAVGNDVEADGKRLIMITGANQGGKSTFLRSVGLAQLMMQCGLFVAAESFTASVSPGIFTHFKREEDATMKQGKLDEELSRMADIASQLTPGGLLLCNESFASTNEQEGSEIGRQIVRALLESGVRVFFVTHLFDLAHSFYSGQADAALQADSVLFLRPERRDDGEPDVPPAAGGAPVHQLRPRPLPADLQTRRVTMIGSSLGTRVLLTVGVDGGAVGQPQLPTGGDRAEQQDRLGPGESLADAVPDALPEREERGPQVGSGVVVLAQRPGSKRSGSRWTCGSRLSAYGLNRILLLAGSRWPPSSTSAAAWRGRIHTGLYSRRVSVTTARVNGSRSRSS